jgi:hypothetical protein
VLKKSLQTWQRSADSRGARAASGVDSQSVLSGTKADADAAWNDDIVFSAGRLNGQTVNRQPRAARTRCLVGKTGLQRDSMPRLRVQSFAFSLEPVQAKLQVVIGLVSRFKRVLVDSDA